MDKEHGIIEEGPDIDEELELDDVNVGDNLRTEPRSEKSNEFKSSLGSDILSGLGSGTSSIFGNREGSLGIRSGRFDFEKLMQERKKKSESKDELILDGAITDHYSYMEEVGTSVFPINSSKKLDGGRTWGRKEWSRAVPGPTYGKLMPGGRRNSIYVYNEYLLLSLFLGWGMALNASLSIMSVSLVLLGILFLIISFVIHIRALMRFPLSYTGWFLWVLNFMSMFVELGVMIVSVSIAGVLTFLIVDIVAMTSGTLALIFIVIPSVYIIIMISVGIIMCALTDCCKYCNLNEII